MNTLPPFKSLRYAGRAPGTRLIVLGAVHGNETCGTRAIERVLAELDRGALALAGGFVVYGAIRAVTPLRLTPEQEFDGADLSIHRIGATPEREASW